MKVLSPEQMLVSASPTQSNCNRAWLRSTEFLDLEDSKLRLRAQALMQLCCNDRERALRIYSYVKRMPFPRRFDPGLRSPRQVLDAGHGAAQDKAALLVALLRLADVPSRLRYVELKGDILRGLDCEVPKFAWPLVEVWLGGRWIYTDTYIFDAVYLAEAQRSLTIKDWSWGYGIHRHGDTTWDGIHSSLLCGTLSSERPLFVSDLGVFHDPQRYAEYAMRRIGRPSTSGVAQMASHAHRAMSSFRLEVVAQARVREWEKARITNRMDEPITQPK